MDNNELYNKIFDVVNQIDPDSKEIHLMLGVLDYDAPYLLHYEVTLHVNGSQAAKTVMFDFLMRIDMLKTITLVEQKKN